MLLRYIIIEQPSVNEPETSEKGEYEHLYGSPPHPTLNILANTWVPATKG
jgi:hypothetical protein